MTDEELFDKKRGILADAIRMCEARLAEQEQTTEKAEDDAEPGEEGEAQPGHPATTEKGDHHEYSADTVPG